MIGFGTTGGRAEPGGGDHALLQQEIPALRRYARVLVRDPSDADDLVGECLVRAVNHLATRRPQNAMRPWLFTIMRNLFISDLRRKRRRGIMVPIETATDAALASEGGQEQPSRMRDLRAALAELPAEQREVLMLVTVEDLSYAEVAQLTGLPIGTVMSRLHRARQRVRSFMDGTAAPVLRRVK